MNDHSYTRTLPADDPYDVVVAGGGPAGSAAARRVGEKAVSGGEGCGQGLKPPSCGLRMKERS
jgi:alkyl hydroperoxide reductase subunit AhpF